MWVTVCLQSARHFILVNRSHMKELKLEWGWRQGDPLYLFFCLFLDCIRLIHYARGDYCCKFISWNFHRWWGNQVVPFIVCWRCFFLGHWYWEIIENMMHIIELLLSCLLAENKSSQVCFFGVGVLLEDVKNYVMFIGCAIDNLPFYCLGLLKTTRRHML